MDCKMITMILLLLCQINDGCLLKAILELFTPRITLGHRIIIFPLQLFRLLFHWNIFIWDKREMQMFTNMHVYKLLKLDVYGESTPGDIFLFFFLKNVYYFPYSNQCRKLQYIWGLVISHLFRKFGRTNTLSWKLPSNFHHVCFP